MGSEGTIFVEPYTKPWLLSNDLAELAVQSQRPTATPASLSTSLLHVP